MKCQYRTCKRKRSIIGHCKYCKNIFCNNHRLPEDHICINLENYRNECKKNNENILMKQKCVVEKISLI